METASSLKFAIATMGGMGQAAKNLMQHLLVSMGTQQLQIHVLVIQIIQAIDAKFQFAQHAIMAGA
jgi:hypothetical protein